MPSGVDALLENLLYHVAISGERGLGWNELQQAVEKYFRKRQDDKPDNHGSEEGLFSKAPPTDFVLVDDAFIGKVWEWIAQHPDIQIKARGTDNTKFTAPHNESAPSKTVSEQDVQPPRAAVLRLFTNLERTWQVIAGHEIDYKRIPLKEFECLCVIAAYGQEGCLQPDVFRLTGQDKRSVPKRTDKLQRKGYIVKEHIIGAGTRTTRLKLRRFATDANDPDPHPREDSPEVGNITDESYFVYSKWFDQTIQLLKGNDGAIALDDLRAGIGVDGQDRPQRAYRRCWNRLVKSGCLRKIKAKVAKTGKYIRCLQLMREPTSHDRLLFGASSATVNEESLIQNDGFYGEDDSDGRREDDVEKSSEMIVASVPQRIPPQWTPDTVYTNLVFNLVENAGSNGISSMDLSTRLSRLFWRRPLDDIMMRLTDIWQTSQPPHLRHLAIVRDTGFYGKLNHFVYRTFGNFQKAVDSGQTVWEAVIDKSGESKSKRQTSERLEAKQMDKWGFPLLDSKAFSGSEGQATFLECQNNALSEVQSLNVSELGLSQKPSRYRGLNIQKTPSKRLIKSSNGHCDHIGDDFGRRIQGKSIESSRNISILSRGHTADTNAAQLNPESATLTFVSRKSLNPAIKREIDQYRANAKRLAKMLARAEAKKGNQHRDDQIGTPEAEGVDHVSTFESRVEEIKAKILSRVEPGVYINPPGSKSKWLDTTGARGRPPKHILAVFKLTRLIDFPWFKEENTSSTAKINPNVVEINSRNRGAKTVGSQLQPGDTKNLSNRRQQVNARSSLHSPDRNSLKVFNDFANVNALSEPASAAEESSSAAAEAYTNSPTNEPAKIAPRQTRPEQQARRVTRQSNEETGNRLENYSDNPDKVTGIHSLNLQDPSLGHPNNGEKDRSLTIESSDTETSSDKLEKSPVARAIKSKKRGRPPEAESAPHKRAKVKSTPLQQEALPSSIQSPSPGQTTLVTESGSDVSPEHQASITSTLKRISQRVIEKTTETDRLRRLSKETLHVQERSKLGPRQSLVVKLPILQTQVLQQDYDVDNSSDTHVSRTVPAVGVDQYPKTLIQREQRDVGVWPVLHETASPSTLSSHPVATGEDGIDQEGSLNKSRHHQYLRENSNSGPRLGVEPSIETDASQNEHENTNSSRIDSYPLQRVIDAMSPSLTPQAIPKSEITGHLAQKLSEIHPAELETARSNTTKHSKKAGISQVGGIVRIRRENIVLDVIRRCRGVFPGNRELWYPFAAEWKKLYGTNADRHTVDNVVSSLLAEAKLKRFFFRFIDEKSRAKISYMLLEPRISPYDSSVKELQANMIAASPRLYIPSQAQNTSGPIQYFGKTQQNRYLWEPRVEQHCDGDLNTDQQEAAALGSDVWPSVAGLKARQVGAKHGDHDGARLSNDRLASYFAERGLHLPKYRFNRDIYIADPSPSDTESFADSDDLESEDISSAQTAMQDDFQLAAYKHDASAVVERRHITAQPRYSLSAKGSHKRRLLPASDGSDRPKKRAWKKTYAGRVEIPPTFEQRFHSASGTFGTFDVFNVLNTANIMNVSDKRELRNRSVKTGPDHAHTQPAPKDVNDILHRAHRIGIASNIYAGSPDAEFFDIVRRVRKWEYHIAKIGAHLRWTGDRNFINLTIAKTHVREDAYIDLKADTFEQSRISHRPRHASRLLKTAGGNPSSTSALWVETDLSVKFTERHHQTRAPDPYAYDKIAWKFDPASAGSFSSIIFQDRGISDFVEGYFPADPNVGDDEAEHLKQLDNMLASHNPTKCSVTKANRRPSRKTRRSRRQLNGFKNSNKQLVQRLCAAVALVRNFCDSGKDEEVQWNLVEHAMGFGHERPSLQMLKDLIELKIGSQLLNNLQAALTGPFLAAYERDELPKIDFSNLSQSDWPRLTTWVEQHVLQKLESPQTAPSDPSSLKISALPQSRETLMDEYDMSTKASRSVYNSDEYFSHISVKARCHAATEFAFSVPLTEAANPSDSEADALLDQNLILAKSLARAIIMTPEESYNAQNAASKMTSVGIEYVEVVNAELLQTKTISQIKNGRQRPGRNFIINRLVVQQFRRWNTAFSEHRYLREVAASRQRIVQYLSHHDGIDHDLNSNDADSLVLLEMVAQGHLTAVAAPPERNDDLAVFGSELETSSSSKSGRHPVDRTSHVKYTKTLMFTPGDELKRGVSIPLSLHSIPGESCPRCPFWIDINGSIIENVWDMVVRSVLHVLAFRPGSTAVTIEAAHKVKLWAWEIDLVLAWMEEVGIAERFGTGDEVNGIWKGGWKTSEWWYCAFMPDIATWRATAENDDGEMA